MPLFVCQLFFSVKKSIAIFEGGTTVFIKAIVKLGKNFR
jgi:hypothetical protein